MLLYHLSFIQRIFHFFTIHYNLLPSANKSDRSIECASEDVNSICKQMLKK